MSQKRQLIVQEQPKSPIAEAYRTLRTNIQFSKIDGELKVIMFTSSGPGEGKSTTIANTAVAMAQSGKEVVLVDCDLRKPVQHRIFGLPNRGLTNILVEEILAVDLLQQTSVDHLRLLSSGPIPPNPSELLESAMIRDVIQQLKEAADYVLIDVPPAVAVTDASVLASRVDGVIMVLSAGMARPEMAQKAKEMIQNAQGHLLGVVLNRVEIEKEHAYYYYYYGSGDHKKKRSRKRSD